MLFKRPSPNRYPEVTEYSDAEANHALALNRNFNMNDMGGGYHNGRQSSGGIQLQQQGQGRLLEERGGSGRHPFAFVLGGRRWYGAAARLVSGVVVLVAVIAEVMFVSRDASPSSSGGTSSQSDNNNDDSESSSVSSSKKSSISTSGSTKISTASASATASATKRLVRLLARETAAVSAKASATSASSKTSSSTSSSCQYLSGTDVLTGSIGLPVTLTLHIFTAVMLFILLVAEVQLWRWRLHSSSMMNIGLVQIWAGLNLLSRTQSDDSLSQITSYALLVVGAGNFIAGLISRFGVGGPRMSLFGTGSIDDEDEDEDDDNSSGEMMESAEMEKAKYGAGESALLQQQQQQLQQQTGGSISGISEKQLRELLGQAVNASASSAAPVNVQPQPVPVGPTPTQAVASGYAMEASPLTMYNPFYQQHQQAQIQMQIPPQFQGGRPGTPLQQGGATIPPTNPLLPTEPAKAPPAYLLSSPFNEKTQHKQWRSRIMKAYSEQGE